MIPLRQDSDAQGLRLLARLEKVGKVVLRLLGIAHILDGRVAHALLLEIFTPEGIGTMVNPPEPEAGP